MVLKFLWRVLFGIEALVGTFLFTGCEEDEDNRIWIEEGKREIVYGADGETDAIRVDNVGAFSATAVVQGDTTYGVKEEGVMTVSGDWFYVKLETNDVLIVQVDSNKSYEPRELMLELTTYNDREFVHITQMGNVRPIK